MNCGKRYIVKQQRTGSFIPATVPSHRWLLIFLWVFLTVFPGAATEEGEGTGSTRPERAGTDVDSLRKAVEQLRIEATHLREKAEALDGETAGDAERQPVVPISGPADSGRAVTAPKDTVELLSKEGTHAFLESFRGKKRGSRERGYGGGIGAMPGIFVLNMRPVHELLDVITSSSDFRNISFPLHSNYQGFFMMGIIGYGALGNGLRVGGSYQSGSRSYSTREHDTTYTIDVHTSFGGFLLEKAAVAGNMNWFAGGLAGGAVIDVNPSKASNVFSTIDIDDAAGREFNKLSASALLLELHGGFTYTMVGWFHIGGELSTPLYFSPSGFKTPNGQSITNGFVSVNPGLRIRIILGNIG